MEPHVPQRGKVARARTSSVKMRAAFAFVVLGVAGFFHVASSTLAATNHGAGSVAAAAPVPKGPVTNTASARPDTNVVWPNAPTNFWQKARAEEVYRRGVQNRLEQARKEQALIQEALAVAQAEHNKVKAQINAPPPPPGFIESHREWFILGFVLFLFSVVSKLALDRHREEAEIRALAGGYLSDGTEVARFLMPDLFALPDGAERTHDSTEQKSVGEDEMIKETDPLAGFFEQAPRTISTLSDLLKDLNGLTDLEERRVVLTKMGEVIQGLIDGATPWALRPAWQVATSLHLLINRVAEKTKDATPSVTRTIASGLDCLRELCVPGIRANLIIEPALKILAVDDDALCRRAVAFALQKAGLSTDFAENGSQAVEMARQTAYDMVFMDIQMPELDGITACAKMRELEKNAQTPVVFVTVQSDFSTRAQTTAIGGSDFLAKPFLVFEITVKAVVSAARKRLALLPRPASVATPTEGASSTGRGPRKSRLDPKEAADLKNSFFNDAPRFFAGIRSVVDDLTWIQETQERHEVMQDLHVRLVTLAAAAKLNELKFIGRAAAAVESLARKLVHDSKSITPSTVNTLTQGITMLERACLAGGDAPMVKGSAVRLLVVEDEPLARRAIVGALQLAFERPDSAHDGAAALKLCRHRRYDVIFTDIAMPKMDGVAFCRELRLAGPNTETPVVFITSHGNDERRNEVRDVGGADFITKPFLPAEITVKALILASEHRLNNASSKPAIAELVQA